MPKSSGASLKFPPEFYATGQPHFITEFNSKSLGVYIRELVQNALDAHLAFVNEGGRRGPCEVRFVKRKLASKNLPDFAGYKNALQKCVKAWENEPVVQRYLQELSDRASLPEHDLLLVYDNGIGFTEKSMNAVLSEGAPKKTTGSLGSFHIGHLSAFGMSGLQYILYAGKSKEGRIAAGHAVLASHENSDGMPCSSSHGYYVNELDLHSLYTPYIFVRNEDIDSPISDWLEKIDEHGSVVAISDFNYFNRKMNDDELMKEIVKAVIVNFAIAILKGDLRVSLSFETKVSKEMSKNNIEALIAGLGLRNVEDKAVQGEIGNIETNQKGDLQMLISIEIKKSKEIDKESFDSLIDEFGLKESEEKAVKGVLANIDTFRNPDNAGYLDSPFEDCDLRFRNDTLEHGVAIWRNGMLIKRNHRSLSRKYFGDTLFDALVLLNGKHSTKTAHDLVKEVENPFHNEIDYRGIDSAQRKMFKKMIQSIKKWLIENAKPL